MASSRRHELTLPLSEFDLSLLPPSASIDMPAALHDAIGSYLRQQFRKLGGGIEKITYTPDGVRITWLQPAHAPDPLDPIIHMLQSGDVAAATVLMRLLLSDDPDNPVILYNLGMALSDRGDLDDSILFLRRLCELEPDHANGRIALGVALMRHGDSDQALKQLQQAAELEPTNPWAHLNLGACLLTLGRVDEGILRLREATGLSPTDKRAWLGLAQALEQAGDDTGADEAFQQVLAIDEYGDIAEMARQGRTRIAQRSMRRTAPDDVRMDVVFYILSALEQFSEMSPQKVQ